MYSYSDREMKLRIERIRKKRCFYSQKIWILKNSAGIDSLTPSTIPTPFQGRRRHADGGSGPKIERCYQVVTSIDDIHIYKYFLTDQFLDNAILMPS